MTAPRRGGGRANRSGRRVYRRGAEALDLVERATEHAKQGRRDDAEDDFRLAIDRDPDCIAALSGLGDVLAAGSRRDEAISCFRRLADAVRRDPPDEATPPEDRAVVEEAAKTAGERILKLDVRDDRHFTMTIDRVTFDYNSIGMSIVPAHLEKPIFDANPAEYRNKTAYDTDSTNPGLAFGPYRIVEVVPGSRIALEQNASWTGEKPHFKRIVVKIIENTAARGTNSLCSDRLIATPTTQVTT